MKKKRLLVLVVFAALVSLFVAFGGYLISRKGALFFQGIPLASPIEHSFSLLTEKTLPTVTFSLNPAAISVQAGKSFDVAIMIESKETILATDLDINYDPKIIVFEKIKPGDFFSSPIVFSKSVKEKEGKIFYALGSLSSPTGKGTLAILTFKGLINSQNGANIRLGDKTMASVKGDKEIKIVLSTY